MAPAAAKLPARKRNRKRKRRAASSSSSSSSSSSNSSSDDDATKPKTHLPLKTPVNESSQSSSSSSDSESDSDSDSSSNPFVQPTIKPLTAPSPVLPDHVPLKPATRRRSPSPDIPAAEIPSFIPLNSSGEMDTQKEQALKDKFRNFWMASVADGFKDDLEEIRKVREIVT